MCEAINYQPLTGPILMANAKTLAINIGPHLGYVSPTKRRKGEVVSCEEKILPFPRVFRRSHVANNPINRIDPSGKLSPVSVGACTIALAAGGAYDLYSTIKKGVEIQEKYESKINKIKDEQKTCSSSNKLKLEQEKMKLLNQMQMESMANAATAYLPGVGSATAAGACLLMLSTF